MEMRLGQRLHQTLAQRITQAQRLQIANRIFQSRMALMQELHGEEFKPKATCPQCGHVLSPAEMLKGFSRDPQDYDTTCPKCKRRFQPILLYRATDWASTELAFYCPAQTLDQLRCREALTPDELRRQHPAVYQSAKVHYGTLTNAFRQMGIAYAHKETIEWSDKVRPFLGQLSDAAIADCAGVSKDAVRKLRQKLSVKHFNRRALARG